MQDQGERKSYTKSIKEEARRAFADGMSVLEIAKALSIVNSTTIYGWLPGHGVDRVNHCHKPSTIHTIAVDALDTMRARQAIKTMQAVKKVQALKAVPAVPAMPAVQTVKAIQVDLNQEQVISALRAMLCKDDKLAKENEALKIQFKTLSDQNLILTQANKRLTESRLEPIKFMLDREILLNTQS